ncbi:hypothetical protein BS78_10G036200 [Paspalum vaginatum]|nr:hypothetical protein BS78_10G036200 [Paspalum vaginatum]
MRSRVRVLAVTHVLPAQGQAGTSSLEALPDDEGHVKLSFMDALFVDRVPMQRLFFYEGPGVPPFPSLVHSLKSSLAAALAIFRPLAGKLTHRALTGDVVVDCSPAAVSPGVRFVEAEYAGSVHDMRRLAVGEEHHTEALMQLGAELSAGRLPAPVLAVQVTRPAGGGGRGVVVGVSVHHAVADGHSLWRFMRAWSAVSRDPAASDTDLVPPTWDRTAIRYPEAEEVARKFLRTIAPALPVARPPSLHTPLDQRRRSFLLRAEDVRSLKQRVLSQSKAIGEQVGAHPSAFVAVSSLVWTSIVRAKSLDPAADAYLLVPVDLRRRLRPPVERYFGNCVAPCFARAAVRDLCDDGAGLGRAAAAIRDAVRARAEDPLGGAEQWLEDFVTVPKERLTRTGSSNRFMAYDDTDFGWGAPSRVELVSLFTRELVLLLGAVDGGVQVTVALDHAHMDGLAANFLQVPGLGR